MSKLKFIFWMMIMISPHGFAKEVKKVLVVGEKLIEKNPWRNELIKKQYEVAIAEAMKQHKNSHPKTKIELIESFDNGPQVGFEKAAQNEAFGVLGYLYSSDSLEGSKFATTRKIPFITPVSPLNSINNDYAYSLASSHNDLATSFKNLRARFDNPSIIISSENFLPNFEYVKTFQESFNVIKTYKGTTTQVWETLSQDLHKLVEKNEINILFASFAFEQMELLQLISRGPFANKVRFIGNAQWNYCPRLLSVSLSEKIDNFFVVSDYFDSQKLNDFGFHPSDVVLKKYKNLKDILSKEPSIKGHEIDEPIVYVLFDMLSLALEVAEQSSSREDFNKKISNLNFEGAVGSYQVSNKKSQRKVYLGTWDGKAIKPVTAL